MTNTNRTNNPIPTAVSVLMSSMTRSSSIAVSQGDTDAFELLVDRYHRVLFSVALRMLGDRDEAADATQTAFVKVYERLTGYRAEYPILQLDLPYPRQRVSE